MYESLKGTLYSSNELFMKNVVSNGLSFLAFGDGKTHFTTEDCSTTIGTIKKRVLYSTISPKIVKTRCSEVMGSNKKSPNELFIKRLCYNSIFAKNSLKKVL